MSQLLLAVLPMIYLAGAIAARSCSAKRCWVIAEISATAALLSGLFALFFNMGELVHGRAIDALGLCMVLLIALLGWVIVRYSRRYLLGEDNQVRYAAAMLFTLASVSVVAVTQHFGVLIAAWITSSLGLHQLLLFFQGRAAAQIVAHKKFMASRLAETCFVIAAVLLYAELHTLSISAMAAAIIDSAELSWSVQAAAVLIALGAILKSAQLPVHGWLIQVMEAPTPVSALLHAGIVNLGGFALIRLSALIAAVPAAQILLIVVGSLTAVLAGLVMMTRISIKVRLAWSTCAQMGFMLMECGLGLYDLALLHLFAHSLYKAYAFLSAGEAVLEYKRRLLLPQAEPIKPFLQCALNFAAAPASLLIVALSLIAWHAIFPRVELSIAAAIILAIGIAPLLWARGLHLCYGVIAIIALTQLYFVWHMLFSALVTPPAAQASMLLTVWVCALFAVLFIVQVWLRAYPHGRFAQVLYPWVYYGFYLDERFTRLTFRLWPARIERKDASRNSHSTSHNPFPGELV